MRTAAMVLTLALLAGVAACGDDDSESSLSEAATPAPTDRPTDIPEGILVAEMEAIPLPPGADTRDHLIVFEQGEAGGGFYSTLTAEEVTAFFASTLPALGWSPEGDPDFGSIQNEYQTTPVEVVNWVFLKDDMRLLVGAQLNGKHEPSNEVPWVLRIQPIWYPGLENSTISPSQE